MSQKWIICRGAAGPKNPAHKSILSNMNLSTNCQKHATTMIYDLAAPRSVGEDVKKFQYGGGGEGHKDGLTFHILNRDNASYFENGFSYYFY